MLSPCDYGKRSLERRNRCQPGVGAVAVPWTRAQTHCQAALWILTHTIGALSLRCTTQTFRGWEEVASVTKPQKHTVPTVTFPTYTLGSVRIFEDLFPSWHKFARIGLAFLTHVMILVLSKQQLYAWPKSLFLKAWQLRVYTMTLWLLCIEQLTPVWTRGK